MTFDNLPNNWSEIPLWDNDLSDVVDLFLGIADRLDNSLLMLITDEEGTPVPMPITIHHINWDDNPAAQSGFTTMIGDLADLGSRVLVAFGHRTAGPTTADLRWRTQLTELLSRQGLTPIDFFSADPVEVRRVPEASAFAA